MWLTPNSEWRNRAHRMAGAEEVGLHGRADAIDPGKTARVVNTTEVDPLSRMRKTLRQHYKNKRRHYGVDHPNFYDRDLRRLFSESPEFAGNITAAQFLARNRRPTRRLVASWTGIYQHIDRPGARRDDRAESRAQTAPCRARRSGSAGVCGAPDRAGDELLAGWRPPRVSLMKKLRILALVHDHLVPPEDTTGIDILEAEWKMEHDVIETLREMSHSVRVLGLHDELGSIRPTVGLFKPHIVFNLMEAFAGVTTFDQNVVSYLELLRLPYTGCNPRGLILARDKSLSKQLLAYHRIGTPDFVVVRRGRPAKLKSGCTFRSS